MRKISKFQVEMIKFRMKQGQQLQIADIEIITLVKDHEFLFNPKHSDYRNLPMRGTVWLKIAKALNIADRKCSASAITKLLVSTFHSF